MTKDEMMRILILLSQVEGFVHGKVGVHTLPDYMSEELTDIVNILADKIKDKE